MKILKLLFNRIVIVSLAILLQMALYVLAIFFGIQYDIVLVIMVVAGVGVWLKVITDDINPAQQLLWTALILFVPIVGMSLYFMLGESRYWFKKEKERMRRSFYKQAPAINPTDEYPEKYEGQIRYLKNAAGTCAYKGCSTKYFSTGEKYFASLLKDIEGAEKYIFMEFFIIQEGKMWNSILDILKKKALEGVDVKVMYDDIGCVMKLPSNYAKKLNSYGIKAVKFNPFTPFVTNLHNNRDHRKIAVIDGVIGYTGGINLADEYINEAGRNYYWKDTGVRIYGNAVGELAELFLQLYEISSKRKTFDFDGYIHKEPINTGEGGIVVPFGTGPSFFYKRPVAEEALLSMISCANKEIMITTPYLIVDYALNCALVAAATRGVDVKIVIPDVPDKRLVYLMTKSNAEYLYKHGVKIYRATGSFLHAKSVVVDGESAFVGTINFDYRSFIHHFENGVFMVQTDAVEKLYEDVNELCSEQNEFGEGIKLGVFSKVVAAFLKILAPLF